MMEFGQRLGVTHCHARDEVTVQAKGVGIKRGHERERGRRAPEGQSRARRVELFREGWIRFELIELDKDLAPLT